MDIDLDVKTSFDPLTLFNEATRASMINKDELKKHPCGIYFQQIPKDPNTGFAAIPYKQAEALGYFKVDFLHLSVLDVFENKEQIRALLKKEPNWDLLKREDAVKKLFHLNNWGDVLNILAPTSIEDVADCLALIRPKKQELIYEYVKDKEKTRDKLYKIEKGDKTSFKRSHAIAYAMVIVLQLHLIEGGIL